MFRQWTHQGVPLYVAWTREIHPLLSLRGRTAIAQMLCVLRMVLGLPVEVVESMLDVLVGVIPVLQHDDFSEYPFVDWSGMYSPLPPLSLARLEAERDRQVRHVNRVPVFWWAPQSPVEEPCFDCGKAMCHLDTVGAYVQNEVEHPCCGWRCARAQYIHTRECEEWSAMFARDPNNFPPTVTWGSNKA